MKQYPPPFGDNMNKPKKTPRPPSRDQFAMAALQGLLAGRQTGYTAIVLAVSAYQIADAMLEARKAKC